MDVYVMLYFNKHGTDFSVYAEADLAYEAVVELIREDYNFKKQDDHYSWGSDELQAKVGELLKVENLHQKSGYIELLEAWAELTNESFEVDARTVHTGRA